MKRNNALDILKCKPLGGYAGEYLRLGLKTGLFNTTNVDNIYARLSGVEVRVDNTIPGDAYTTVENGKSVILLNEEKCNKADREHFIEEVIFHEFSHLANDIHRELFVYKTDRMDKFGEKFSHLGENNSLVKYPIWGMFLLDEAICQYTAQLMVNTKYDKEFYPEYFIETGLTEPKLQLRTKFYDYPEIYKFAEVFSKTIFSGDDSLHKLCKTAYNDTCMDIIFEKYNNRENGLEDLYEILGYMGNVLIADYSSKGFYNFEGSETNKDRKNVNKSMVKVLEKTNKIIEEN